MTREANVAQEIAKSAPPIGIAGASVAGVAVSDWLIILALIYTTCQIIVIAPKVYRTILSRRRKVTDV